MCPRIISGKLLHVLEHGVPHKADDGGGRPRQPPSRQVEAVTICLPYEKTSPV